MAILISDKIIDNFKRYYTIGEVAKIATCETSAIRFWEREGVIGAIRKSKQGDRLFTREEMRSVITTRLLRLNGVDVVGCRDAHAGGYAEQLLKALREFKNAAGQNISS